MRLTERQQWLDPIRSPNCTVLKYVIADGMRCQQIIYHGQEYTIYRDQLKSEVSIVRGHMPPTVADPQLQNVVNAVWGGQVDQYNTIEAITTEIDGQSFVFPDLQTWKVGPNFAQFPESVFVSRLSQQSNLNQTELGKLWIYYLDSEYNVPNASRDTCESHCIRIVPENSLLRPPSEVILNECSFEAIPSMTHAVWAEVTEYFSDLAPNSHMPNYTLEGLDNTLWEYHLEGGQTFRIRTSEEGIHFIPQLGHANVNHIMEVPFEILDQLRDTMENPLDKIDLWVRQFLGDVMNERDRQHYTETSSASEILSYTVEDAEWALQAAEDILEEEWDIRKATVEVNQALRDLIEQVRGYIEERQILVTQYSSLDSLSQEQLACVRLYIQDFLVKLQTIEAEMRQSGFDL